MYTNGILIKDIRPGLKNINVQFIVLEVGNATVTKENKEVRTFKVADQSACINASIWGEPGALLFPGDIVRMTKGYAVIWRHCLTLYSGKNGDIHKLGDFCMLFNEQLNMSEPNPNFAPQQGAGGPQQQGMNNGLLNNGGNAINGGNNNNNGRGQGVVSGGPSGGFNGNPSTTTTTSTMSNSNSSSSTIPATKATRLSNENKGGGGGSGPPPTQTVQQQKNNRGGRSSNSRNVK